MNLITVHGEEYSIQSYVLKFVSDLRQVDGFLQLYTGFLQQQNLPARYFIALVFFFIKEICNNQQIRQYQQIV